MLLQTTEWANLPATEQRFYKTMLETLDLLFTKAVDLQKMRVEVPRLTSLCRTKKRKEKISLTFFQTSLHKNWNFPLRIFSRKCDQIRSILQIWSHLLKQPIDKCSFSMHFNWFQLIGIQLDFFSFVFFPFVKRKTFMSLQQSVWDKGENTKLNQMFINIWRRTYYAWKKDVSSVTNVYDGPCVDVSDGPCL